MAKSCREEAALGDGVLDSLSVPNGGKKIINAEISLAVHFSLHLCNKGWEREKKKESIAAVDKRSESKEVLLTEGRRGRTSEKGKRMGERERRG